MIKINMVVADADRHYVGGLVRYISKYYGSKVQLNYFTDTLYLYDYLENSSRVADILLIGSDMLNLSKSLSSAGLVVVLSSGRQGKCDSGYAVVNRYLSGEQLLSTVLGLYAEKFPGEMPAAKGEKKTKAVAVFSPAGGVGNSTLAVALAAVFSGKGKRTFYLNLENTQSTPVYFQCHGEQTLTDVVYFIKDKHKAVGMKISTVKQVDTATGIHYLCPPESITDLEALMPEELSYLVDQIRELNQYDRIVIDMPSRLDPGSIAVLDACDVILVVSDPGCVSKVKIQRLEKEFRIVGHKTEISLFEKSMLVMNKVQAANDSENPGSLWNGKPAAIRIPKTVPLLHQRDDRYAIYLNNDFGAMIQALSNRL